MSLKKKTSLNSDLSPFGFIEWDVVADTVTVCPYLAETLAFPTKDTTQACSTYRQLTHPDDIAPIETLKEKIKRKKEEHIVVESRKLCRDGTWRWFGMRGKITKTDKDGNPLQAIGTCYDTTQFREDVANFKKIKLLFSEISRIKACHKKCQEKCQSQSASFKKTCSETSICSEILHSLEKVTSSSDPVFIFPSSVEFDNEKFESEPLVDHNKQDIDTLSLPIEKLNFIKTLKLNKKHTIQNSKKTSLLGIRLDLPFGQQGLIILERDGPFESTILDFLEPIIGIITHIISFNRLEASHNELDSVASFFIKQVPAPVAMFDTNMCYKFASDAWCKAYNLDSPSDLIGKSHYEISPQQPAEFREKHLRGLAGEILSCSAEKITGFTEEPFWTEWTIHPWYTQNKSIGGIIIYSNVITDRINSEINLKAAVENLSRSNQALKKSNQALDRFAHVCSHDLKEPLRSVSNLIQLLFNRNSEQYDEESLLYIRHALKGINRMNTLIKDILSYSETTAQSAGEKVSIDLNKIMNEINEVFYYRIYEIDARLNVGTLPTILGSATQINQLFTNLISNAIKFRSEKPLIIDIFAVDVGDFWEIHVRDNGIGIAQEYHEGIFTMFKRLHSKNQYEGSGIGLATCQKIVNDHGGEIYVQSAPEGGSDFIFTLPKV